MRIFNFETKAKHFLVCKPNQRFKLQVEHHMSGKGLHELTTESFASYDCMDGVAHPVRSSLTSDPLFTQKLAEQNVSENTGATVDCCKNLTSRIHALFTLKEAGLIDLSEFIAKMRTLMSQVDLTTSEINKYTFWDSNKPYTRNLVAHDDKRFSLLLLCWSPGRESKVHNHPGEGCFMQAIRGTIKETRYKIQEDGEIVQTNIAFLSEGQGAFIDDSCGLHKITNPNPDMGAVSLHCYVPPFKVCKVWAPNDDGRMKFSEAQEGSIGFFSVFGVRTPHLEGGHNNFNRVMKELVPNDPADSSSATTTNNNGNEKQCTENEKSKTLKSISEQTSCSGATKPQ